MRLVNGWNGFNHDRRYVQYDQGDNKPVNDPVPLCVTQFRVEQHVNLFFGCVVHRDSDLYLTETSPEN